MTKQTKSLLILLCVFCLLIASCEKGTSDEIIPEPSDSLAIFDLIASDSTCAITPIIGTFLEGKPLSGDQKIQIEVNISKTGKWSFSTDTINGFSFSGSGVFEDTGKHVITLTALGTPVTTGNINFSITRGSFKRTFSIAIVESNITIETPLSKCLFKATIGGVKIYVVPLNAGPDNIPYGGGGKDTASFSSFLGQDLHPYPAGTGAISLQKGYMYNFLTSTEADFKNFFKPGAYPFYTNLCSHFLFSGMILFWADSDDQTWTTFKEFQDQAGSSFTIVGIEDGHDNKGIYFVKVKSRFNCKLYNMRTGEIQELTDGELVSYFKKPK